MPRARPCSAGGSGQIASLQFQQFGPLDMLVPIQFWADSLPPRNPFSLQKNRTFSEVQELLPTPWKLLELGVALPQCVLCKAILTLIVILTLAAR